MKPEDIDYNAVLADLRAKKAAATQYFDQAIAGIEGIIGAGALSLPIVTNGSGAGGAVQIRDDAFFNLNILEATKKYLAMTGRMTQTIEQITEALGKGGLVCQADSVTAILQRALKAKDPDLCRPNRGRWGLSAWYAPPAR